MIVRKDSSRVFTLVDFESEEKARAREHDPRRQEGLPKASAIMVEIFDGPPEFIDLTVANAACTELYLAEARTDPKIIRHCR